MKGLFSPEPLGGNYGLGIIRIFVGMFLLYHGHEVFRPEIMKMYFEWDVFKGSLGTIKVYAGKIAELTAGLLLTLGLFTRIGAIIIIGTMGFITFFVGKGRFWYEDQHPFLFVLFGILFLTMGPGAFSLDGSRKNS